MDGRITTGARNANAGIRKERRRPPAEQHVVIACRRAPHLAVVVEELSPAFAVVMPHFAPRVVHDAKLVAAQRVREEDVFAKCLVRKAHFLENVCTKRAVAADQKILIAPRRPIAGEMFQELKKIHRAAAQVGRDCGCPRRRPLRRPRDLRDAVPAGRSSPRARCSPDP